MDSGIAKGISEEFSKSLASEELSSSLKKIDISQETSKITEAQTLKESAMSTNPGVIESTSKILSTADPYSKAKEIEKLQSEFKSFEEQKIAVNGNSPEVEMDMNNNNSFNNNNNARKIFNQIDTSGTIVNETNEIKKTTDEINRIVDGASGVNAKEAELSDILLTSDPLERVQKIEKSSKDIENIKSDVAQKSEKLDGTANTSNVKSIEKYTDEMRKYIIPPEDGFDALIERRYIEIRKAGFDDVSTVAKNTGLSEQDVIEMKEHLFLNTHDLSVQGKPPEKLYFQGNANIAYGWQKAQNGELTDLEKEWFKELRNHELTEKKYMDEGMPLTDQSTWDPVKGQGIDPLKNAHDKANLTAEAPGDFPGYADIASKEWNKNWMNDSNDY